jgi:hypothetical protein
VWEYSEVRRCAAMQGVCARVRVRVRVGCGVWEDGWPARSLGIPVFQADRGLASSSAGSPGPSVGYQAYPMGLVRACPGVAGSLRRLIGLMRAWGLVVLMAAWRPI